MVKISQYFHRKPKNRLTFKRFLSYFRENQGKTNENAENNNHFR